VTDLAKRARVATIQRRLVSIAHIHKRHCLPTPTTHAIVREVMRGIRRTLGIAQASKDALSVRDLRAISKLLPDTPKGLRDRALLLVGFAGAFRRNELISILADDVRFETEGLIIRLRKSKTDQEASGVDVGIPFGANPTTCPVRALQSWLNVSGISEGPIFREVSRRGRLGAAALTGDSVARIVQSYVAAIGLDWRRFGAHSLRSGFATSSIRGGASERAAMRQTRHRSRAVFDRYVKAATIWSDHAGYAVGL
jgi:integrase